MSRRKVDPLRPLKAEEHLWLERISRSQSEPAGHVARAKALLAVADGASYTKAARVAGRKSGNTVSRWVSRFNGEGIAAVEPRHGGGPQLTYTVPERERILAEMRRTPDREQDGTATWSLSALQRSLRKAPDGLPGVAPIRSGMCFMRRDSPGRRTASRSRAATGARRASRCAIRTSTSTVARPSCSLSSIRLRERCGSRAPRMRATRCCCTRG
ncbi:MAG: helix-turn-helix domain-containing protein [Gemmatimonadota bacterium]|nr:helix-turn-helix domain-containing protein [Gemmatimonadota bacterium]